MIDFRQYWKQYVGEQLAQQAMNQPNIHDASSVEEQNLPHAVQFILNMSLLLKRALFRKKKKLFKFSIFALKALI